MKTGIIAVVGILMILGSLPVSANPCHFEHYTMEDGLCDDRVSKVLIDGSGAKWFGTSGCKVSCFDERGWTTYQIYLGSDDSRMMDMTFDQLGRLWTAVLCGDAIYYLENGRFESIGYALGACSALASGPDDHLWAGGFEWVGRYDHAGDRWLDMIWDWNSEENDTVNAFVTDTNDDIWFITQRSPFLYRAGELTGVLERFEIGGWCHQDIAIDRDGKFWIVSNYYLMNSIGGERDHADEFPAIICGRPEGGWQVVQAPRIPGRSDSGWCLTAVEEMGLWVGCYGKEGGGAFWFDYEEWRWIEPPVEPADIAVDPQSGDVWFATRDGVYVMRGGPDAWPPVWIELEASIGEASGSDMLSLKGSAEFQMELELDLYVAVELPDGNLLFAPNWTPAMTPYVSNLSVPIGLKVEGFQLTDFDMTGHPAGTYRWFAACTHAGTMEFASNIASCEWQFVK